MHNNELLDPEMPTQLLRLHMGELSTDETLVARAAIEWANTRALKLKYIIESIKSLAYPMRETNGVCGAIVEFIESSRPIISEDGAVEIMARGICKDLMLGDPDDMIYRHPDDSKREPRWRIWQDEARAAYRALLAGVIKK